MVSNIRDFASKGAVGELITAVFISSVVAPELLMIPKKDNFEGILRFWSNYIIEAYIISEIQNEELIMAPKHTKPAARELIVDMAHRLSTAEIAHATGKSRRTIQRILSDRGNGEKPNTQGRPRVLNYVDLNI